MTPDPLDEPDAAPPSPTDTPPVPGPPPGLDEEWPEGEPLIPPAVMNPE